MGIRGYKPNTPSRRKMSASDFADLTKGSKNDPEKSLLAPLSYKGGRDNAGRTAVRFRGGRHKRRYRIIDFRRDKVDVPARVKSIEYDPNRSARIALLHYLDGEKRYILAPVGLKAGDMVLAADNAEIQPGNSLPLAKIPLGTIIHNVEMKPGKGGQLVRSAGTSAQLMAREGGYALLRMPSGETRKILDRCRATIGQVGNIHHENIKIGKAGRTRWLGRRPHNRGVTMNPVDHPHGGGEGRTSGGRHPVSPWGKPTRGAKTRKRVNKLIVSRRTNKSRK